MSRYKKKHVKVCRQKVFIEFWDHEEEEDGASFTSANAYFVFLWRDVVIIIPRVLEDGVLLVVRLCHQGPCRYHRSRTCKHALTVLLKRYHKTPVMLLLSS